MTQPSSVVVVGGGLAGAKTVEALRERGYTGRLVLIGAERELPYERPPLSKDYLMGKASRTDPQVHDGVWYADHSVDLRLGVAATAVDAAARTVTLADGTTLSYDALVLATGSEPRHLSITGSDAAGVRYLRRLDDSDAIRAVFGADSRLAVIGGGWIGLEVAAAARQAGTTVTILEAASLPLLAVLGEQIAAVFAKLHTDHGTALITGASVASISTSDGRVTGVRLADGREIEADAVVIGVGAAPNLDLARTAGLELDHGVLVDGGLRTSDANIWAVGDIANLAHPFLNSRIRVEHWASALNQPAVAAATVLGEPAEYADLPYFFTDQFDLGMEYVGHAPAGSFASVVIRGDLDAREFVAFWVSEKNTVLAGMNVNVWDVVDDVKAIILSRRSVDLARLADPDVPLRELI